MQAIVESIQSSPAQSFTCLDHDLEAFHDDYHRHIELELTWIVESSGKRLVGDKLASFVSGDLVLIGSNLPHQYRSEGPGPARAKVIQFAPEVFGSPFLSLPEFRSIETLQHRARRGLSFSNRAVSAITPLIEKLFQLPEGSERAVALISLLLEISKRKGTPLASLGYGEHASSRSIARIGRVIDWIDRQTEAGDPVQLQEAARVAALHPQSVSRFFLQHTGMNFQRYLQVVRIGKAAQKLIETDDPISSIALDVGYASQSNFNRQFQQIHKMTPTQYRAELGSGR
ncbi:MAG: AraC family transcriptional regulator [Verrucomicrobiota bacterium]